MPAIPQPTSFVIRLERPSGRREKKKRHCSVQQYSQSRCAKDTLKRPRDHIFRLAAVHYSGQAPFITNPSNRPGFVQETNARFRLQD
ncbi:Uncharacterized protein HZ326_21260 [Fusarium oxysporum f. sp. albedinis]|nr:Uncharacterized protein HZ326_21260 [Fusarium oxysporum f. sp. albedinis]